MCFGQVAAPEPIKIEKPVFVRNPFLDDDDTDARSADALRRGRSSLVIPSGTGIGFEGAGGSVEAGVGGTVTSSSRRRGAGTYGPRGIPAGYGAGTTGGQRYGGSSDNRSYE